MSVISIETAALSKSRLAKGFNGDSINLNRRVSSVEEMNNGYRAAGKIAPPCVCTVASAPIKGVAAGAVTAFDDYSHTIYKLRADAQGEMKRYSDDMASVAAECGVNELSLASVCVFSDKILASSVGRVKIFVRSQSGVSEISSDNGEFKFSDLSDLQDGGFIVVLGAECAAYADTELIEIVTSQSDNIKAVSKALFTSLNKVAKGADITAVFFKITADKKSVEPETVVSAAVEDVPVTEKEADAKPEDTEEPAFDEASDANAAEEEDINGNDAAENDDGPSSDESSFDDDIFAEFDDEEEDESDKKQLSAGKKLIGLIPFIVLAALVGIVLAVYVFTGPKKDDLMKTTASPSGIYANADADEPVTEPDSKNNEESTTAAETTTAAPGQTTAAQASGQTTAARSNNTNTQPSGPSTQPSTAAPTTQRPTAPPTTQPTTQAPTTPPTTNPPTTQPTTRITDQGNHKPFG